MQVYKAAKYIRLSYTDDKSNESNSVGNQRKLIEDFVSRHPEIESVFIMAQASSTRSMALSGRKRSVI